MLAKIQLALGPAMRWAPIAALSLTTWGCAAAPEAPEEVASLDASALENGRVVKFVSAHSGLVLDVKGISQDNGAPIHQWSWLGADNQKWRLEKGEENRFELVSVNSGKCLDIAGVSQENGAIAQQFDCWNNPNQRFALRDVGGGQYEIVATHSGKCVDVEGVSRDAGAAIHQWDCIGGENQRWYIEAVDGAPPPAPAPPPQPQPSGKERFVTILYSTWADHFGPHADGNGNGFLMSSGPPYASGMLQSPAYAAGLMYSWWGEPAFGSSTRDYRFMIDNDPERPNDALIDYHADLLHQAGVDFISIDLSNGNHEMIVKAAQAVAKRYSERPRETTPKIAFFTLNRDTVPFIQSTFYSGRYDSGVFFNYLGKPLLLVAQADTAIPTGGALDAFTTRHTWAFGDSAEMWSFKSYTDPVSRPGRAFSYEGQPEEMSVAPACQATYMTSPEGRKSRNNGAYFEEQWRYVFDTMPKFVFVTAWNEWGSQNLGDAWNPVFTDTFGTENSADIEPMKGGHGDHYYQLMKDYIRRYKER